MMRMRLHAAASKIVLMMNFMSHFILVDLFFLQLCEGTLTIHKTVEFRGKKDTTRKLYLTAGEHEYSRAVNSFCPPPYCVLKIHTKKWIKNKLRVKFTVTLVRMVEPMMRGNLNLCWADENHLRLYPKTNTLNSCNKITRLNVDEKAMTEPLTVDFYTWFMDEDHHKDLRLKQKTTIKAPLIKPGAYKLPLYVMIYHQAPRDRMKYRFLANWSRKLHISRKYYGHVTRAKFDLTSNTKQSNTVTLDVRSSYYYPPDDKWFPVRVVKNISIEFIKLPLIEVKGHSNNIVYLPYYNKTAEFFLDIYSTSDVETIHIARSDGAQRTKKTELIPQFLGQEIHQLRAKYKINIPYVDSGITGNYTISIANKHGKRASQSIRIHRLQEMVALVNPKLLEAEEGTSVTLHCLVLTDLPLQTKVFWQTGSPEKLPKTKVLSVAGDRRAIELTLLSVKVTHSGMYTCSANSGFQTVTGDITLQVFPRGAPEHQRQKKATWVEKLECDKVVDTQTFHNVKLAGRITVGIGVVSALGILVTIIIWKVYSAIKSRETSETNEEKLNDTEQQEDDDADTLKLLENLEKSEESEKPSKKKHKKKHKDSKKKRRH